MCRHFYGLKETNKLNVQVLRGLGIEFTFTNRRKNNLKGMCIRCFFYVPRQGVESQMPFLCSDGFGEQNIRLGRINKLQRSSVGKFGNRETEDTQATCEGRLRMALKDTVLPETTLCLFTHHSIVLFHHHFLRQEWKHAQKNKCSWRANHYQYEGLRSEFKSSFKQSKSSYI